MKRKHEIEAKISVLIEDRRYWQKKQAEYKWTDETKKNGSHVFGAYQEKESECNDKIAILKWVLE